MATVKSTRSVNFAEAILTLSLRWDEYWKTQKTNKDHPIHLLIHRTIPSLITQWLPSTGDYKVKGSDGQGNLLRTPWINIMNRSITESAEEGYYIVFLFDSKMSNLIMELGFGATQFISAYGQSKPFFTALEKAVINMQQNTKHLLDTLSDSFKKRLVLEPSNLFPEGNFKLRAYEKCSIYHLAYDISSGLDSSRIQSDFMEMLRLYDLMADSILLPQVEDYVIEAAALNRNKSNTDPFSQDDLSIPDYLPHKRKYRTATIKSDRTTSVQRRSTKAEKIGKLGEEFVYVREKARLNKEGRSDLAAKVIWHRNYPENRQPGWDISSFDEQGNEIYIEVKSSVASKISSIEVTSNELAKMREYSGLKKYVIFLVAKVAESPQLLGAIWDPAPRIDKGEFSIRPEIHSIDLRTD